MKNTERPATAITVPKQLTPLKPGQSGNPDGRPKGSRNQLGEAFLADVYTSWLDHGPEVISRVIEEKPDAYLKVIASIMPKELNIRNLDDVSDDEVIARLRQLERFVRPFLDGGNDVTTAH